MREGLSSVEKGQYAQTQSKDDLKLYARPSIDGFQTVSSSQVHLQVLDELMVIFKHFFNGETGSD